MARGDPGGGGVGKQTNFVLNLFSAWKLKSNKLVPEFDSGLETLNKIVFVLRLFLPHTIDKFKVDHRFVHRDRNLGFALHITTLNNLIVSTDYFDVEHCKQTNLSQIVFMALQQQTQ